MLVRFAIKSKLRKSGIPNPESLLVAVDYLNDKGEITARGRNNDVIRFNRKRFNVSGSL